MSGADGERGAGVDDAFWNGRSVMVTGHTGFKGGWLCLWLASMGARVTGYALTPDATPSFFELTRLADHVTSVLADVRDSVRLAGAVGAAAPEIIFHLAAQPLVRRSYRDPVETFETNVMGVVHLLEAVRAVPSVRAVVVATSDKCYEAVAPPRPHREDDPMGGHDPYSASKGCAELVTASYRRSFFEGFESGRVVGVATARAGNVLGGGDFAADRILPDAIRALSRGAPLIIRNPHALRPWQHVLDALRGYLLLGERLLKHDPAREPQAPWAGPWNFGPDPTTSRMLTVGELADLTTRAWGGGTWRAGPRPDDAHEAPTLLIDPSRANALLGWRARESVARAVALSVAWYRFAATNPSVGMFDFTRAQIREVEGEP